MRPQKGTKLLAEEVFDQLAIVFVFDAGEEACAEFLDGRRFVERQTVVHLSTAEVARHALGLKDWFELSVEVDSRFWLGSSCWSYGRGIRRPRRPDNAARLDEQQCQRNHDKHEPHVAIIRLRNPLRNGRCVQLRIPRREPDVLRAETISGFFSSLI